MDSKKIHIAQKEGGSDIFSWPISKSLLDAILNDFISDRFTTELVWERLGYKLSDSGSREWIAGDNTPSDWRKAFPEAPEIIKNRKASIYLTRSIPKENKQLLKEKLNFKGYSIKELYPRRTRRATAVNWLLSWAIGAGQDLTNDGPLPKLLEAPQSPISGHPGDPAIE